MVVREYHFSAYNQLTNDESYTCWDHPGRRLGEGHHLLPKESSKLRPGVDNYQSFLPKVTGDRCAGGVMASESVQQFNTWCPEPRAGQNTGKT